MFRKILVALDLSPMSRPVFDCALSLAKSFGAALGLLYVFSLDELAAFPISKLETLEEYPGFLDDPLKCYIGRLESGQLNITDNPEFHFLQTYTRQALAAGVSTEFFECLGAPGIAICDFARSWEADLIVIGHRGRSGLSELVLGSVSNYVIHHARCSVQVVYQPQHAVSEGAQGMRAIN